MGLLARQLRVALQRATTVDVDQLNAIDLKSPPRDLASQQAIDDRRRVLVQTHGDTTFSQIGFERLIGGDELQPVNYLAHGVQAAKSVCRLTVDDTNGRAREYATGFLVAPRLLLTNNHVFPTAGSAQLSSAEFDFELDLYDQPKTPVFIQTHASRAFPDIGQSRFLACGGPAAQCERPTA